MWGREGVQREFFQCKNALLSGAVGRHGTGAAGALALAQPRVPSSVPGKLCSPAEPGASRGCPRHPAPPFPRCAAFPGLNTPKRAALVHWRGCLGCPSAESCPCAQGLSFKSFYFNIIIITHLQLKSVLLKKYSPSLPNTHMHSQAFLVLLNTTL